MGPLALLDLIGLDTAYEILETMYTPGPGPAARAGARSSSRWSLAGPGSGRKTGRGFYTYAGAGQLDRSCPTT
ncbi:MAG: 3-hydroxyacyl-CoA dehydrogenase family protein [Nocardioides sp.]